MPQPTTMFISALVSSSPARRADIREEVPDELLRRGKGVWLFAVGIVAVVSLAWLIVVADGALAFPAVRRQHGMTVDVLPNYAAKLERALQFICAGAEVSGE